jgi:chromosome segregation protein
MRLKRLILHGFKSFADRTEFLFDAPITGIVGPNGCGKSNVVDAVKWVLGEQSAKSLRGDAMADVIFNGSATRKPSGMSEVTLVFENPRDGQGTRTLNVDTDEVAVGRRLFRDGTSEYQLNNQPSRLRDVRELFLDTGIGVDAYSVIEQGRVSQLLEANPEERRQIFEEAAGISKYKAKKKEAQRKLERVEQNLLRLRDIVDEVEKRLRSVRIQAGRARTYQEHTQRLGELRLTYAMQEYHGLHVQQAELLSGQGEAERALSEASARLAAAQEELAAKRAGSDRLAQEKQDAERRLVQAEARINSVRQRQEYAAQQIQQNDEQLGQLRQDHAAAEARSAQTAAALEAESAQLLRLSDEVAAQQRLIEQLSGAHGQTEQQRRQGESELEDLKSAVLDLMRQVSQLNNRLGAIQIERRNVASQQQRIEERQGAVASEARGLGEAMAALQGELDELERHLGEVSGRIEQSVQSAAELGRRVHELAEQLAAAREHRSGLLSRQRLLEDLEARREGMSEGVKAVLRQRQEKFGFITGVVADLLRVDVEHALVIEAALDGRDQFLVATDSSAAAAARESLAELEGRVNILCTDRLAAFEDGYDWNRHPIRIRRAVDLAKFLPGHAVIAQHLLGRTIVTDDLSQAMELSRVGPADYRYVTKDAEVVEPDGTLRVGPTAGAMGLLSRRSELEALGAQIAEVDRRIESLAQQVDQGNAQAKAIQEDQGALRADASRLQAARIQVQGRMTQNADRQGALGREQSVLSHERAMVDEQSQSLEAEDAELAGRRQGVEAQQASHQRRIEELSARQAELAQVLSRLAEEMTGARIGLGQTQEKQLSSQQSVRRLEAARVEVAQQIERLARSIEQTASRRAALEAELAAARAAEEQLRQETQALAESASLLAAQAADLHQAVETLSHQVDQASDQYNRISQTLHELQLKLGELRVRLEGLVQRTMDELQLDLPARYAEHEAAGGYQPAQTDWDAVAAEIKELRDKIQRLGNVNLDAINELAELEQRQQFLSTQVNDLTTSKQQLEELIATINAESSVRFEQTFNAVREHFQGMFRKLFGGGKADIYLETELEEKSSELRVQSAEADAAAEAALTAGPTPAVTRIGPLEAGIEIIARPPGKQPVSISQLSGGEKTMTCVALLMSIFKSKPSPFCILDEVDAALDEANNQRFNLIVQEFLDQSQFVIITHSKRTMQITDVLYGVTMQEQGVSKRVAVKFDQVDAQGRIAEQAAA